MHLKFAQPVRQSLISVVVHAASCRASAGHARVHVGTERSAQQWHRDCSFSNNARKVKNSSNWSGMIDP
jgi:hypothetical protein